MSVVICPSTMFHNEKELLSRITEASEAIRRKHRMLKLGKEATEQNVREFFKPMINPIEKLVTHENKKDELKNKKVKLEVKEEYLNNLENTLNEKEQVIDRILPNNNNNNFNENDDSFLSAEEEIFNSTAKNIKVEPFDFDSVIKEFTGKAAQKHKQFDTQTGVRQLQEGLKVGDSPINFEGNKINIGNTDYMPTLGLLELLFKKSPDKSLVNEMDLQAYRSILLTTNAHKKNYKPTSAIREDKTDKYKNYISKMFETKKGSGVLPKYMIEHAKKRKIDYLYWDDPNELVDRLRLLVGSQAAGNTSHNNEIMSIIEELRESNIIY